MRLTRQGLWFHYHGDEMLWIWPWKRSGDRKFVSMLHDANFETLNEYWEFVGVYNEACRKEKITGYSESEILLQWTKNNFRHNIVIILCNINVEMKDTLFWKSIEPGRRKQLLKNFPVLFFYDIRQATKVAKSIAPEFADVFLFVRGELHYTNINDNEINVEPEGTQAISYPPDRY